MSTKYLIIQSDSLENAKKALKNLILNLGYSEYNYQYLVGEKNIGKANNQIIKNNTILNDWGNGNYCFGFDKNIVAEYGSAIETEASKHNNIIWCDNISVREFMPKMELI